MHLETVIQKELFHNIGKLFYAIAASDKEVQEIEVIKMKQIITSEILSQDEIESDADCEIENAFDWSLEQSLNARECYEEFKVFYTDHPKLFTENVKKMIFATSNAISNAYTGKQKSEIILVKELNHLLKKAAQ